MKCQSCGHTNPAGSVFCQQCGTRLSAPGAQAICARCGGSNEPHMRFCVHCGNNLRAASEAEAPPRPAPKTEPEPRSAPIAAGGLAPTPVSTAKPPSSAGAACWRCHAAAEPQVEFCKFCGARYSDGAASPPSASAGQPRLVSILKDGTDGAVFPLGEQTDIGRTEGDLVFADDPYLSPRHARIRRQGGRWSLRDLDSVNGVYVRLREPVELNDGDHLLIGQQVLRFELLEDAELPLGPASVHGVLVFGTPEVPRYARLVQYTTEGLGRDVHYLYRDETVLGRENGDVVFTDDPFLSRRHAAIVLDRAKRQATLRDLGSSNGTAIRLRGERTLRPGDQFRIGRHLFRFDEGAA